MKINRAVAAVSITVVFLAIVMGVCTESQAPATLDSLQEQVVVLQSQVADLTHQIKDLAWQLKDVASLCDEILQELERVAPAD